METGTAMADYGECGEVEMSDEQKKEIAKWFLLNSPAGEIQYVAKGVLSLFPRMHLEIHLVLIIVRFRFFCV